jgi:hypothetical protein
MFIIALDSLEGPHERRLLKDLLSNYQVLERPVANESEPILVSFGLTLQQIIDVVSLKVHHQSNYVIPTYSRHVLSLIINIPNI